jgi:hypothetical protein
MYIKRLWAFFVASKRIVLYTFITFLTPFRDLFMHSINTGLALLSDDRHYHAIILTTGTVEEITPQSAKALIDNIDYENPPFTIKNTCGNDVIIPRRQYHIEKIPHSCGYYISLPGAELSFMEISAESKLIVENNEP